MPNVLFTVHYNRFNVLFYIVCIRHNSLFFRVSVEHINFIKKKKKNLNNLQ